MKYTCIQIQGNLISEDILQKIENGTDEGQSAKDFGLDPSTNLRNEIEYAWSRIKLDWKHFSERSQSLPAVDQYGTTLSRKWMTGFLSSLNFELSAQKTSLRGDNHQNYSISHIADNLDGLPFHLVGFVEPDHPDKNTLDIKTSGGTSRFSPHGTMQEYLNVTENIYGIAANGLYLRLIRDSGRLIKLNFVEFDLKRMLEEDKYSEFTILYRLLHSTRFPRTKNDDQCLLEKYYRDSIETGNRIRDGLSMAVKESLLALGAGFLQNEGNTALRERIKSGALSSKDYYRQLLRIIYRFLFLMVTEERDLVYDPDDKKEQTLKFKKIYWQYYSIARLRNLSENRYLYEAQFTDLWLGLVNTFLLFEAAGNGRKLGIQPLDGDLFSYKAIADLQSSLINNKLLLECVRNLNEFTDDNKNLVPINYRSLDVEELGSVYEGLLELHPVIESIEATNPASIIFTFHEGTERKTTGSYYTRPELVNELIKSALIPVIEERLKETRGNKDAQAKALLKLKVCDAAAGSGHMLLAAGRTIAWYLARVQSGEENPAPSVYRKCLREVIQHCVYGVDMNPDAVELCKLALWLEGHNSGKPLSFLDHKIRNGNSLVGVTDLKVLEEPIPDEAFAPVTGDDKDVCKELKKRNAHYRKTKQIDLFSAQGQQIKRDKETLNATYAEMESIEQDTVEAVMEVKNRFSKVRKSVHHEEKACHIWTAAFFKTYTKLDDPTNPSSEKLAQYFIAPTQYGLLVEDSTVLAIKHNFFHWPLEFPDVFEQGGFDVILGNPPWEIVELSEKEFFSTSNKEIANADSSASRTKLIEKLGATNPALYARFYERKRSSDSQRKFIQFCDRFPESSKGRIDLYPLFLENSLNALRSKGMCALIMPSSIAMGAYNSALFSKIVNENRLKSFFDFENSKGLFPSVHKSYRISLITISGQSVTTDAIELLYFGKQVSDLLNSTKRISIDKALLEVFSPNTLAPPIILTSYDLSLAKKIYSHFGVLNNRKLRDNKWKASIKRMLSLSDGDNLFKKSYDLSEHETTINSDWTRLYSGKAIYQYDHRYASYKDKNWGAVADLEYSDPTFKINTEYYAKTEEVLKRTNQQLPNSYLVGFRDIARSTDERTCIASIVPRVGCDSHCRNLYFESMPNYLITLFLGNLNSLTFDYFVRQKVIGTGLGSGTFEQLPVLPPNVYTEHVLRIIPFALELIYTSWEIKPFADDLWNESELDLQDAIEDQWKENKAATGGHEWRPPTWSEDHGTSPELIEGCPIPPFKWDENRRAALKAELDAIYAKLYGLTTEELRYILDPQDVFGTDFPGETFRVLKEKEIRLHGEYRTKKLVLEAWKRLHEQLEKEPALIKEKSLISDNFDKMVEFDLDTGIYTTRDVAEIANLKIEKVRRWFKDLSKASYEGLDGDPNSDIDRLKISFHGLIELFVIGSLRKTVSLQNILKAREELKDKTGKRYPFATVGVKKIQAAGRSVIFESPSGPVTLNGTGQLNLEIIREFFRHIEFNLEGLAEKLFPPRGKGKISVDPKIGQGKPVIAGKSVWAETIAKMYTGPESVMLIKDQYNLQEDEVLAAVEYFT